MNSSASLILDESSIKDDQYQKLREAYMGHSRWMLIDNKGKDFDSKIKTVKENVHYILGHQTGNQFYKKFLIRKQESCSSRIPIQIPGKLKYEESQVDEIFLKNPNNNDQDGRRIIEQSIVREGSNRAFNYTHKVQQEVQGQTQYKKRIISAAEYIDLET